MNAASLRQIGLRWLVLLICLAIWQALALLWRTPFFPPPLDIAARVVDTWFSGSASSAFLTDAVWRDIVPSLQRMVSGWLLAVVIGIGLGTALGSLRRLAGYIDPVIHFVRAIPPPALLPLFMVLLGIGDTMKVSLITVGVLWPILLNTIDGVRSVEQVQLDTARAFRFSTWHTVRYVVLPSASPKVLAGMRISLSLALILMVISEMIAGVGGIGYHILYAQRVFRLMDMWAGILLLSVLGYLFNTALLMLEGRVLHWQRVND